MPSKAAGCLQTQKFHKILMEKLINFGGDAMTKIVGIFSEMFSVKIQFARNFPFFALNAFADKHKIEASDSSRFQASKHLCNSFNRTPVHSV